MASLRKILDAFSAKEASIATGVILAAMTWALTRLADTVGAYNALEYELTQKSALLADGGKGFEVRVKFANLSGDTTLSSVTAQLSVHGKGVKFSEDPEGSHCAVEPPGWAGNPTCKPMGMGFDFAITNLAAGTAAGFDAKYTRSDGITEEPVLRIELPADQNFRLIKSGVATSALRYQPGILAGFAVLLLLLLVLSVVAGVREPNKARKATPKSEE